MRRIWLVGLLAFVASSQVFAAAAKLVGTTLYVNDSPVIVVRSGSPVSRTKTAIRVLSRASSSPSARAVIQGSRAQIYYGDRWIFRVEPEDAAYGKSDAGTLAKSWAANINRALTLPPLVLGSKSIKIGNGKEVRLPMMGRLASKAAVESSDESVVLVRKETGNLVLMGKLAGSARIAVVAGGNLSTIEVRVVPFAAVFPQYASVSLSGVPATNSVARGAVENAIWNQLKTSPSSNLKFSVPEIGQIPAGQARTLTIPVRAIAPEALSAEGNVVVTIRNVPQVVQPETELWYCNHPESLAETGQVFGANLLIQQPIRLLYHHINEARKGLLFHAQLINSSDKAAELLLIPGTSQTDKNPVLAGMEAGHGFLRNWLCSSGERLVIPAHSSLPLVMKRLAPKDTVSGLVYLALLSGPESVLVRADAKLPFQPDARWSEALSGDAPWRVLGPQPIREEEQKSGLLSEHVYPQPFRALDVSYSVGGRHGFVRIGQQPIPNSSGDMYLDGNFGVQYTIRVAVDNPTAAPAEIEVVFEASAGYSGAIFAINGQIVRTPLLQPKEERRILRMKLEAGASRQFTMSTIPLSGGSYPATLAIRPLEATSRDVATTIIK